MCDLQFDRALYIFLGLLLVYIVKFILFGITMIPLEFFLASLLKWHMFYLINALLFVVAVVPLLVTLFDLNDWKNIRAEIPTNTSDEFKTALTLAVGLTTPEGVKSSAQIIYK